MATIRERFEKLQRYFDIEAPSSDGEFYMVDQVLALADELDANPLADLAPEARLKVMAPWCRDCGGPRPCNCGRDE